MAEQITKVNIIDLDFEKYSIVENPQLLSKITNLLYELRDKFFADRKISWLDFGGDGFCGVKMNEIDMLETAFKVLAYIKNINFENLGFPEGYGRVRIALHYSQVSLRMNEQNEIENVSSGIGQTSRVQSVTEPNEIFATKAFLDNIQIPNDYSSIDLGNYKIGKGHDVKPINVFVLFKKNDTSSYTQRLVYLKENLQNKTEEVKDEHLLFLTDKKDKLYEEIKKLYDRWINATPEMKGGYRNLLDEQNDKLKLLKDDIESHQKKS